MEGGRDYFDALVTRVSTRESVGYNLTELMAALVEINFAQYRALVALGGGKNIPDQIKVPRPGVRKQRKMHAGEFQDWLKRHGN